MYQISIKVNDYLLRGKTLHIFWPGDDEVKTASI